MAPLGETWWLDDAERLHARHPESFFIPPPEKRHSLRVGDQVKLIFRFAPGVEGVDGERMWVAVTSVDSGRYEGELLNEPDRMRSIRAGERVPFGPEHVAAYAWSPEELGYDSGLSAWVRSESAEAHGQRPARVSMRPPELRAEDGDSGWTLGRGDESARAYTDEAMFSWAGLGWLTDLYPELEPVFQVGDGDWVWNPNTNEYVRVGS